jgi:fructose-bisphosphate aldolase class II
VILQSLKADTWYRTAPRDSSVRGFCMTTLREALERAQTTSTAVGHFNVTDLVLLKAVFGAARQLKTPVLIGVSEGERDFIGVRQIAALVRSLREEFEFPVFLNADHTHSLAKAVEAARAGFDAVAFDASALPFDENMRSTREAVQTLKAINPAIMVEGEIGDIGTGSEIHAAASAQPGALTTPEEAMRFVEATGVDILAPAVGNMHGLLPSMVRGEAHKHLEINRIAAIKRACGALLTLHGGSGTDDNDFRSAIDAGINIVHINTELRVAWRRGLEQGLSDRPQEVAPYKILASAVEAVEQVVLGRMRLFARAETTVGGA